MRRAAFVSAFVLLPLTTVSGQAEKPTTEIVAVFTTMASCCEPLIPMLRPPLDSMRMLLAAEAARRGAQFKIVGVSLDWEPEVGWEHLKKYGRFDEVTVGGNWRNISSETLISQDSSTNATRFPQVLVYEHTIAWSDRGLTFSPRRTLTRVHDIPAWVRAGAPIPR